MLASTGPVFVVLVFRSLLKERVGKLVWGAIPVAFCGLVLEIMPIRSPSCWGRIYRNAYPSSCPSCDIIPGDFEFLFKCTPNENKSIRYYERSVHACSVRTTLWVDEPLYPILRR